LPNPHSELPKTFRSPAGDLPNAESPGGWILGTTGEQEFYGEHRKKGQKIGAPREGDPKIVAVAIQQFAADLARITADCFMWRKTVTPYPFEAVD
jgi:hypothetical protein